MSKGPKFNKPSRFTTRDSLGINSVAASIQAELCPVVNTVTPRAFYWPFMVWNYYDYLTNVKNAERTVKAFDEPYLKKNDYFFVLSNLITNNPDKYNLVGQQKTDTDLHNNPTGPYAYNKDYFVTRYGGMQYYNAGCLTLGFITDRTDEKKFDLPRLTREIGKPMAKAFEEVIKDTEYYRHYRLSNDPVPYDVLRQFGEVVTLDLHNFDKCKALMRKALFEPVNNTQLDNRLLIRSAEYAEFIYRDCEAFRGKGVADFRLEDVREVLFDYYSPSGEHRDHDRSLDDIIMRWEILVGRQYFTMALELIWKQLMMTLESPMSGNDWLKTTIESSEHQLSLDHPIGEYIPSCNYTFSERERMIAKGYRETKDTSGNFDTALRLLFSLYNRFSQREDVDAALLNAGGDISLTGLFELINEYQDKSVSDFLQYIIKNWIIAKHQTTALNKMIYGRDGYFFERIEGLYSRRVIPSPDFQGIRMMQLMQVMKDLDMLE